MTSRLSAINMVLSVHNGFLILSMFQDSRNENLTILAGRLVKGRRWLTGFLGALADRGDIESKLLSLIYVYLFENILYGNLP